MNRNTATYGNGLQPWDLQKDMPTWGSVFVDARRTDAMEYLFRVKGDRSKQLEDAKKALHNVQVIIEELEKEEEQLSLPILCAVEHTLANIKYLNHETGRCMVCDSEWPKKELPPMFFPNEIQEACDRADKILNGHILITPETCNCEGRRDCMVCVGGLAVCANCGTFESGLEEPCKNTAIK